MNDEYSGYSLVIGRFQPLHLGHMEVLSKCASESDHLIVGIGSAQYSHQKSNPFTAGERYLMIDRALRGEGISNFSIVPVEDLNRYSVWVSHVESMCPPFRRVYTNNPMTRRLFEEAGYEVCRSHIYNRDYYSGTEIRRRMVEDEDWRRLVPEAAVRVIDAIDGVGRVKACFEGDGNAPLRGSCRSAGFQRHDHIMRRILHRRDDRGGAHRRSRRIALLPRKRSGLQQRCQGENTGGFP